MRAHAYEDHRDDLTNELTAWTPPSVSKQGPLPSSTKSDAKSRDERQERQNVPQVSRTRRALIREYWGQGQPKVSRIAEYIGCSPREVQRAVDNGHGDNLDEDEHYLNGSIGEIINVDGAPALPPKRMPQLDGVPAIVREHFRTPSGTYDANDSICRANLQATGPSKSRSGGLGGTNGQDPLFQSHPIPPLLSSSRQVRRGSVAPPTAPIGPAIEHQHPLDAFLQGLQKRCSHLRRPFLELGISTTTDLDVLSKLESQWGHLDIHLLASGASLLDCLLVRDGLETRAMNLKKSIG